MSRDAVVQRIKSRKIIAIVRGAVKEDVLISLCEALHNGGVELIEITFNQRGGVEETAASIKAVKSRFGEKISVGAGTVLTPEQLHAAKCAGAEYIISPDANPEIIRETRRLGLVSLPGALTPTECAAAHRAGADFIKLFPAGNFGPEYLKALRAPLNNIEFLAVGGIHEGNILDFLEAGAVGFGIGSNLANLDLAQAGKFAEITQLAKSVTCRCINHL